MPSEANGSELPKSKISLRIIVIGGSVGGLASAYALQRAGHDVMIIEKGDGQYRSPGIIASPPNMTRVLARWGVLPELLKLGNAVNQFRFMQGETGETIGVLRLYEELMKDLLANFVFMQHGDLVSILHDLALREGVEIRCHTEVAKIQRAPTGVILSSGETMYSDLVVGADGGLHSVTRDAVLMMFKPIEEHPTNQVAFTFSIPLEKMAQHPELKGLAEPETPEWCLWCGDSYLVYGSLVDAKRRFAGLLSFQIDGEDLTEYQHNWTKRYPLDHFNLDLDRFEPRIQTLLQLADYVVPTSYVYHSTPESIVCDLDRVVLAGESAHLMLAAAIQPTAMCIEDAEALGNFLSRLHHFDEIPRILSGYEEIRLSRLARTKDWEWRKLQMLTLPHGPEQVLRDTKLQRGTEPEDWELMREMEESAFREIWGEEVDLYAYDATDEAEDWWTKWGSMISTSRQLPPTRGVFGMRSVDVLVH